MKMKDVLKIIKNHKRGYRVHFDRIILIDRFPYNKIIEDDYFPEEDEPLIASEEEAWDLAKRFANATRGTTCNLYVIDENFDPVPSYREKEIKNR